VDARFHRCNLREQRAINDLETKGAAVHRGGWPDFLVRGKSGRIVAVEVKSESDCLSEAQIQCCQLLQEAGIETYIWRRRKALTLWQEYLKERLAGESECSSGQASHEKPMQERHESHRHANLTPDDRIQDVPTSPVLH
jgi:hypothetical protein